MYHSFSYLNRKKKKKENSFSQREEEKVNPSIPIPTNMSQAVHLLQLKAQEGHHKVQETLHHWHQTLGNQTVGKILRQATSSPKEDAASAFKHATSSPQREIPYRQEMEESFGVSFQNVEAHVGREASQGLDALGAEAAAFGNKVAFRPNPSKETVAHELTHVIQQGGHQVSTSLPSSVEVSNPSDPAEREADEIGKMLGS